MMNNNLTHANASIRYHFVFAPRNRRRIFKIEGVAQRFTELVRQICTDNKMELLYIEFGDDYCHLQVSAPPDLSPTEIMRKIRHGTSHTLRSEFQELSMAKQLWIMRYGVTTAEIMSQSMIDDYLASFDKKRISKTTNDGKEGKEL